MADAGRNAQLPWALRADENRVDFSASGRTFAQVAEENLEHSGKRRPEIGLLKMIMNRLDDTCVRYRKRNLNAAAVGGIEIPADSGLAKRKSSAKSPRSSGYCVIGFNLDALNEIGGIGLADFTSPARIAIAGTMTNRDPSRSATRRGFVCRHDPMTSVCAFFASVLQV